MIKKRYAFLVIVVTLIVITVMASTMGFFDYIKVCLHSEVSGVVTLQGKPVVGAEITRLTIWRGESHTTSTTTDAQGHFKIDPLFTTSFFQPWVGFTITQKLTIRYQDKEYIVWQGWKRNKDLNGEFTDQKPHPLTCELTAESRTTGEGLPANRFVETICTW